MPNDPLIEEYVERFNRIFIDQNYWKSDNEEEAYVPVENMRNFFATSLKEYGDKRVEKTIDGMVEMVESGRVKLREKEDHLPNAYQFLKGKNDLRDELISLLLAQREIIEKGE